MAFCTVPDRDCGLRIARELVERKLAACVNLLEGVTSVYRWQGKMEQDDEALLIIKTNMTLIPTLNEAITALHPYELPELIAVPVKAGLPAYLGWVNDNLGDL